MLRLLVTSLQLFRCLYPRSSGGQRIFWMVFALVAVFVSIQGYLWLYGCRGSLTNDQASAVRTAVSTALDDFTREGGALPASAAVLHLRNDRTDRVTAALRKELASRKGWTVVSSSPARAFLKSLASTLDSATSLDEALRPGSHVGIDVIFYGSVADVSTTNGVSRAEISLSAYDTRVGRRVVSGVREAEYPRVETATGRKVVRFPLARRMLAGAVFVILLPWLCAPVVRRVREAKSNAASTALMAGFLAADALCGALLFFGLSDRAFGVALALLVCFIYNLAVSEYIANRS